MTLSQRRTARIGGASLGALALGLVSHAAHAQTLPSGANVRGGAVSISTPSAGQMRIDQTTARAVVDWDSFNIGAGGTVTINQPNQQSAILNRDTNCLNCVSGGSPSTIAGSIISNGAVFLLNPNGIAITKDGVVDTRGGFVASTLNVNDDDFMDGNSQFTFRTGGLFSSSGQLTGVSNAGHIIVGSGGYAALLGGQISNSGTITVPAGNIALAGAPILTLDVSGYNFLQITSLYGGSTLTIDNSGTLSAAGGTVTLAFNQLVDAARRTINMSGLIDTSVSSGSAGSINIVSQGEVAISGTLRADSGDASGGYIYAFGNALTATNATLSANGAGLQGVGGDIYLAAGQSDTSGGAITLTDTSLAARGAYGGVVRVGTSQFHHGVGTDDAQQANDFSISTHQAPPSSAATVAITGGLIDAHTAFVSGIQQTQLSGAAFKANDLEISSLGTVTGLDTSLLQLSAGGRFLLGADRIALLGDDAVGTVSTATGGETQLRASALDPLMGNVRIDVEASNALRLDGTITAAHADPSIASGVASDALGLRLTAGGTVSLAGTITSLGSPITLIGGDRYANGVDSSATTGLTRAIDAGALTIAAGNANVSLGADDWVLLPSVSSGGNITATSAVVKLSGDLAGTIALTGTNAIQLEHDTTLSGAITLTGSLIGGSGTAALRQFNSDGSFRYVQLGAGETIQASISITAPSGVETVYGSNPPDSQLIDVMSGALKAGDTLDTLLTPGSLNFQPYSPTLGQMYYQASPAAGFAMRSGATGYEFTYNGTPGLGIATIAPRPLTVTLDGGTFAPRATVTLATAAAVAGDDPQISGTLDGVPVILQHLADDNYGFAGPVPAGDHVFTLTGIGDYRYALTTPTTSSVRFTVTQPPEILPTGGVVNGGWATIAQGDHAMTITQGSDRAVIDWSSFSIGYGNTVDFVQPNVTSMTLNRVGAGADVSAIDGHLTSTGTLYLINPNGIAIGTSGVIDTRGGFVASTLDVRNDDFLGSYGNLTFQDGAAGLITQAGTINIDVGAGSGSYDSGLASAALIGGRIVQSGTINAPVHGAVSLIAAAQANLQDPTTGYLATATSATLSSGSLALIDHTGSITARTVRIEAMGDADGVAINLGGSINADNGADYYRGAIGVYNYGSGALSVGGSLSAQATILYQNSNSGGGIHLYSAGNLTLTGSLNVEGTGGGDVDLDAAGDIAIQGGTIDAGGGLYGGRIRIGGDYRGLLPGEAAYGSYYSFAGRFAYDNAPDMAGTARSVTIDANSSLIADYGLAHYLDERYLQGINGAIIIRATDSVSLKATIGRSTFHDDTTYGAMSVISLGTLDYAPSFANFLGFQYLELGARNLTLGSGSGAGADESVVTFDTLRAMQSNQLFGLTLMAGDTLRLPQGFTPDSYGFNNYYTSLSLVAGKKVVVAGAVQTNGLPTTIVAGDVSMMDPGGSVAGPASIDLSQASLASFSTQPRPSDGAIAEPGTFTIRLANGGAGGTITLPTLIAASTLPGRAGMGDFGDVTADAGAGTIVLTGDIRLADHLNRIGYSPTDQVILKSYSSTLTLTGNLALAADATIAAPTLSWTDQATATIGGYDGAAPGFAAHFSLEAAGTALYRGTVGQGVAARLDLSGLDAANGASITYGVAAADLVGLTPVLLSGALAAGDTLASLFAPGSVVVSDATGDRLQAGTHAVTVATTSQFAVADGKAGYVFALAPTRAGAITITPRPIGFTTADAQSTYGTLATLSASTLSGVLAGDQVAGTTAPTRNGATVALGDRLAAGSYALTVGALTGASAGNYTIATSGNFAGTLTIAPKAVDFAGPSLSSTYGTVALLSGGSFTGLLAGDDVGALLALRVSGGLADPTARTAAGRYAIAATGLTGASAGNYVIGNSIDGLLAIAPKAITASFFSGSYVYGSPVALVTLDGVLGGDAATPTATLSAQPVALAAVGSGFGVPDDTAVGTYMLALTGLTGAAAGNYVLTGATTTGFGITPRDLRVELDATVNDATYAYGAPEAVVNVTGLRAGDDVAPLVTLSSGTIVLGQVGTGYGFAAKTAVGSYAFRLTGLSGAAASNYKLTIGGTDIGLATITPRLLDWSIAGISSTYGTLATPHVVLSGVLAGDSVDAAAIASRGGAPVTLTARTAVGSYALGTGALSGAAAGNYALAASATSLGTLTIAPKTLDYSVASGSSVYGTLVTPGATLSGLLSGDDVTATLAATRGGTAVVLGDRSGVGQYGLAVAGIVGTSAANYVLGTGSGGLLTITPKALTYSIADLNTTYGVLAQPSATLTGRLDGDVVNALLAVTDAGGGAVTLAARTSVGSYLAGVTGITGAGAANYVLTTGRNGTITIAPRALTYTITGGQTVYGTAFAPAAALGGVLTGDSVQANVIASANGQAVTLGDRSAAGSYALTLGALTGASAGNYSIGTGQAASLVIAPKAIALQGTQGSTYGDLATLSTSLGGLLSGDVLTYTTGLFDGSGNAVSYGARTAAGSYLLELSGLAGAAAGNYTLTSDRYTFTIGQRAISLLSPNLAMIYGAMAPNQLATTALSNVVAGDDVALAFKTPVAGRSSSGQIPVGSYAISLATSALTGTSSGNYVLTGARGTGTLTVTPRPLGISWASGFTYGAPVALGTLSGVVAGDDVSTYIALDGSYLSDLSLVPQAQRIGAGTHSLTIAGLNRLDAANYLAPTTTGTLIVAQRDVTASLIGGSRVYGDAGTPGTTLSGVLPSDAVSPVFSLLSGAGPSSLLGLHSDVGSYTASVTALGGAASANYRIVQSDAVPFQITQRSLSLAAGFLYSTYGDARAAPLANVVAGDDVAASLQVTNDGGVAMDLAARWNAGTYSVLLQGLTGSSAHDYTIAGIGQTNALTVGQRPVQFTLGTYTAVYGDALPAAAYTGTVTNVVAGDQVTGVARLAGYAPVSLDRLAVGTYATDGMLQGASAANYQITSYVPGSIRITPRPLQYSLGGSGIYGDLLAAGTLTGAVAGDDVRLSARLANGALLSATTDVGTYAVGTQVSLLGGSAGNYLLAGTPSAISSFTVLPRAITFAIGNQQRIYGDAVAALPGVTLSNVANGDALTPSVLVRLGGLSTGIAETTPVGQYGLTLAPYLGAKTGDYVIDYADSHEGLLAITPRTLTVAPSASGVYGDSLALFGNVAPGDGNALTYQLLVGDQVLARAQVGTSLAKVALTGQLAGNYILSGDAVTRLTITPRPITLQTLISYFGVYGSVTDGRSGVTTLGANDALNILTGDTVSFATRITDASGGGIALTGSRNIPVAARYLIATQQLSNANYSFDPTGQKPIASYNITPLALDGAYAARSVVYGTPLAASFFVSGLIAGDAVTTTSGLRDVLGNVAAYPDRLAVGSYSEGVTLAGADAVNYYVGTGISRTLTITPRPVYFYASVDGSGVDQSVQTLTYGAITAADVTVQAEAATAESGVLAGDGRTSYSAVTAAGYTAFANTIAVPGAQTSNALAFSQSGNVAVGRYAAFGDVHLNANYQPIFVGELDVTPKAITGTSTAHYLYGDTILAPTYTGLIAGDAAALAGTSQVRAARTNVSYTTGGLLQADDYVYAKPGITGADAADYDLSGLSDVAFRVDPRPVKIVTATGGDAAQMVYGDSGFGAVHYLDVTTGQDLFGPAAQQGWNALQAVTPALLGLASGSGAAPTLPGDANVGTYSTVYAALTGGNARNLALVGSPTLTITPKPITLNATPNFAFTYGDTPATQAIDGILARDSAAIRIQAETVVANADGSQNWVNLVAAGTYSWKYQITGGALLKNYAITAASDTATLSVAKRIITIQKLADGTYGVSPASLVAANIVNDDAGYFQFQLAGLGSLGSVLDLHSGGVMQLPVLTNAGTQSFTTFLTLRPWKAADGPVPAAYTSYDLTGTTQPVSVTIAPKILTWQQLGTGTEIYGDTQDRLTVSGIVNNDFVSPVYVTASGGSATFGLSRKAGSGASLAYANQDGTYTDLTPATTIFAFPANGDVGTYSGLASTNPNYQFASGTFTPFTVTPRPVTINLTGYGIDYGGQHKVCEGTICYSVAGLQVPVIANLMGFDADYVSPVVSVTDAAGTAVPGSRMLPGNVFAVAVPTLSGPRAFDYALQPVTPTTATVDKATIGYQVVGGVFVRGAPASSPLQGQGFRTGDVPAGTVYFTGVANNDPVRAITGFFRGSNVADVTGSPLALGIGETLSGLNDVTGTPYALLGLPNGEAHIAVTAIQYDPAYYRVATPGSSWSTGARLVVTDLSVYNTSLTGQLFSGDQIVPPKNDAAAQFGASATGNWAAVQQALDAAANSGAGGDDAADGGDYSTPATVNIQAPDGQNLPSITGSGGKQGALTMLDSDAGTIAADYTAGYKFAVTAFGVNATTGVSGEETVTQQLGAASLTSGIKGSVTASAAFNMLSLGDGIALPNIEVSGGISVAMFSTAAVDGSLGNGFIGEGSVTVEVGAVAEGSAAIGLGKAKLDGYAGDYFSVGVSGSAGNDDFTVKGGATLMSPELLGGRFAADIGYENGVVSFNMDLGLAIGIGGLDLNFGFSVDTRNINCSSSCKQMNAIDDVSSGLEKILNAGPLLGAKAMAAALAKYKIGDPLGGDTVDPSNTGDTLQRYNTDIAWMQKWVGEMSDATTSLNNAGTALSSAFTRVASQGLSLTSYDILQSAKSQADAAIQQYNAVLAPAGQSLAIDAKGKARIVDKNGDVLAGPAS